MHERKFAFKRRLQTINIVNRNHTDVREFFEDAFKLFKPQLDELLAEHFVVKVGACFGAIFEKSVITLEGEKKETQELYLHNRTEIVDFETDINEFYRECIVDFMIQKIDDVQLRGSGFKLKHIKELNVQFSHYDPFGGSSYIKLPKFLQSNGAIINVRNDDNECFKYAVLSALYPPTKNAQRVNNYKPYEHELDFTGIKFPVDLKTITKFEELNPSISINVYMFDEKKELVQLLRLTKQVKIKHIHLLLLVEKFEWYETDEDLFDESDFDSDDQEQEDNYFDQERKIHYCWIKNLSALLSHVSSNRTKKLFCDRCLNHFTKLEKLESHRLNCLNQNEYQIIMPTEEENFIQFENHNKKLRMPFVIYADIESLLKEPEIEFCQSSSTRAYQQHEAFSVGYYFKCSYDNSLSYYRSMQGPQCIEWFVKELHNIAHDVELKHLNIIPMKKLTKKQQKDFRTASKCFICEKEFKVGEIRVRDHSHFSGDYRGASHSNCNLNFKEPRAIPVVFHNLSHYDSHFIIKELAKTPGGIQVIPRNEELYISFSKTVTSAHSKNYSDFVKLRFIDSFQFMASSLDYLSSLIPSEKKENLRCEFKDLSVEQLTLLERKGIFCYDYVDDWSKLDEKSLPTRDQFYSALTESHISDDEYMFAQKVWKEFDIKTLGEYADLYMKIDIILLADVFENFRNTCYDNYNLDPAQYYTAPGLSFDSMLKYTGQKIELLTDVDKLLFIERGVRGGVSQVSKRYAVANNKYMENFNPNDESKYIVYLDANNVYGWSMMQQLPLKDFEWCQKSFTANEILQIPDDSEIGYIFEVDLDYPQYLHEKHKNYPFCPENRKVPGTRNETKLLLTLFDKKNYVL